MSEIYKSKQYVYRAPWPIFSMAWSVRMDKPFRLALGSFLEDYKNKVRVIEHFPQNNTLECIGEFDHPYPPTKVLFIPDKQGSKPDLIATTGDYLRLWEVKEGSISAKSVLSSNKSVECCAPLTSFDWNEADQSIIGTASIDTTCTIWNIETQKIQTQLIAHDQEVFDIAFGKGKDTFASVSADGSVRMFDLRSLEHSTIVYESPNLSPLLRLAWNKQDSNYLATFCMGSNKVTILDTRMPSLAVAELAGHQNCVNSVCWAPHSSCHLVSGGQDKNALIWDLSPSASTSTSTSTSSSSSSSRWPEHPILHYEASAPVNSLQWSSALTEWVAAATGTDCLALRV